ncbi:MAG: class I SAM-dependent methyltransferase [Desulfobulbaceae bacterium]|nr:class I SAM-dependent methyltransferase [Desulfobulbaceae bacterium]
MEKVGRKFDATEHFNEKRANVYESKIRRMVPGYEAMHDLSLNLLRNSLPSSANILVSGVGTGQEVLAYSRVNATWCITGVDPTEKMLSIAIERVNEKDLSDRIHLKQGIVKDLPQVPCFDAATSILVMQFIPDDGSKKEYLTEITTRLKPGAKFIIIDLVGDKTTHGFNMFFSAWKARQLFMGEDKEEVKKDFEHILRDLQFITENRMNDLLQEAGFRAIHKFFQSYLFSGWIAEKI